MNKTHCDVSAGYQKKTWNEVFLVGLDDEEIYLAKICSLNVIIH